ncbi:hypothetical protein R3P38DRAFT_2799689 [Favolaschia claudopus]|uniref:Uncharacterized protein n=1 Tax=Favolaschia claudopus TaxID=2862362 RepID=A0AAV9ZHE3_9AGAR
MYLPSTIVAKMLGSRIQTPKQGLLKGLGSTHEASIATKQESKRRNSRKGEAEVQKVQAYNSASKEREINAFDRNSRQRRLRRAYCIGGGASIGGGINIGGGVTVLAEVDIGGGASVGGGVWAEVSDIEL